MSDQQTPAEYASTLQILLRTVNNFSAQMLLLNQRLDKLETLVKTTGGVNE